MAAGDAPAPLSISLAMDRMGNQFSTKKGCRRRKRGSYLDFATPYLTSARLANLRPRTAGKARKSNSRVTDRKIRILYARIKNTMRSPNFKKRIIAYKFSKPHPTGAPTLVRSSAMRMSSRCTVVGFAIAHDNLKGNPAPR